MAGDLSKSRLRIRSAFCGPFTTEIPSAPLMSGTACRPSGSGSCWFSSRPRRTTPIPGRGTRSALAGPRTPVATSGWMVVGPSRGRWRSRGTTGSRLPVPCRVSMLPSVERSRTIRRPVRKAAIEGHRLTSLRDAPLGGPFGPVAGHDHTLGPIQKLPPMRRFPAGEEVDVVIVGLGAGGGVLLQRLARAGFRVVGFDAGPFWGTERDWVSDEAGSHKLYWNEPRITGGSDPVELGANNS